MHEIEPIEHQVMEMLLAGDHPTLEATRRQFAHCIVVEREFTGAGFFTTFDVQDTVAPLEPRSRIVLDDVCADVDGLDYGCGFILFVDDGLIGMLECHLWGDDAFPDNPRYNQLYYVHQLRTSTQSSSRDGNRKTRRIRLDRHAGQIVIASKGVSGWVGFEINASRGGPLMLVVIHLGQNENEL